MACSMSLMVSSKETQEPGTRDPARLTAGSSHGPITPGATL